MFDIGFSEVLLISGIALVVLGPEKLPRLAAQAGRWIGRARAMARQFREQLEEEVNLEEVRKAQKAQPKKPEETSPPTSSSDTPSSSDSHQASTSPAADAASIESDTKSDASAPWHSTQPAASEAQTTQAAASDSTPPIGSYQGPDPADFRADTFSHAHPTNDVGANPFTSSGAAEEPAPQSTVSAGFANLGSAPSSEGTLDDAQTLSEANVAAAQAEPHPVVTEKREPPAEAYAGVRPRDNTPGTDNHGNE